MNIAWVYAAGYFLDPAVDVEKIKSVGSTWGSWKTWRSCSTDNVICQDLPKIRELTGRAFHSVCNFYIPKHHHQSIGSLPGLKLYEGEFNLEVDDIEDIVSMHLSSSMSDIVLLLGFDFSTPKISDDRFETHKIKNRHGLIRATIAENTNVQWVVVDHASDLDKSYQTLANLTCDKMENVIQLLV